MTEYGLTEDGAGTVVGLVSAICHGHSLEQAAALNGLDDADDVRVMLYMLLAEAGLVPRPEAED